MKNKTLVKLWIFGTILSASGGFIAGFNGYEDGLSMLLKIGGAIVALVFAIWGMVRLWKMPNPN